MNRFEAVRIVHPTVITLRGEDDARDANNNVVSLDEVLIKVETDRMEQEYNDTQYQRDREAAYAELNQFEMQFDDSTNGTNTWIEAINTIKTQYPKPL